MTDKPSIVSVVEAAGVELRRVGREQFARCPFHAEKTPSFAVNVEKNLFYCHSCHEGGDSIAFTMKLHGCSFKDALKLLEIGSDKRPEPQAVRRREKAKMIAAWAKAASNRVRDRLRDIDERRCLLRKLAEVDGADSDLVKEEGASLEREWEIFCDMDDDLNAWWFIEFTPEERRRRKGKVGTWEPDGARIVEMFKNRKAIDALLMGEVACGWWLD